MWPRLVCMALTGWLLAGLVGLGPVAARAATSSPCPEPHPDLLNPCPLGAPDSSGTTVSGTLRSGSDRAGWAFSILGEARTAHLALQDLWFGMDLQLWDTAARRLVATAGPPLPPARVLQFVKPQVLVKDLLPGAYAILVVPSASAIYDPGHPGYTLRVALSPPTCAASTKENFLVSVSVEPRPVTPFSLATFTAFVDPAFSDLLDFDWSVDGQPVATGGPELSGAPSALGDPGRHQVSVTAREARAYPDPDQPWLPPTITPRCDFLVTPQ